MGRDRYIKVSELSVVLLSAAVQLINSLDLLMIMPLGPDFVTALGIPSSRLGYIDGSYTAAIALSGLLGSFFLDRFDRRKVLVISMVGLALGTGLGACSMGFTSLVLSRIVAGIFGGTSGAITFSIIADVVAPERRGKATGASMAAFAVASVVGLPAGLELARHGGWRLPLLVVAGLGLVVAVGARILIPPLREHIATARRGEGLGLRGFFSGPLVLVSTAASMVVMMSGFLVIPYMAAYFQRNLGYPREQMGLLYLVGGAVTLVGMLGIGALVDRFGATVATVLATGVMLLSLYFGFVAPGPGVSVMAIFVGLMVTVGGRAVAFNAILSRVPGASERARFMSFQSAVQNLASAAGALLATQIVRELPDKRLGNMDILALLSMGVAITLPFFIWRVEAGVRRKDSLEPALPASGFSPAAAVERR